MGRIRAKLRLHRETLHNLTSEQIQGVAGGYLSAAFSVAHCPAPVLPRPATPPHHNELPTSVIAIGTGIRHVPQWHWPAVPAAPRKELPRQWPWSVLY